MLPHGGFSHPERVVQELHVPKGAKVADFGAGSGYFTLHLAEMVGPEGVVTAVDVLPSALEVIKGRAQDRGLLNVVYVRGNLETLGSSRLADNSQDMVLLANILFQSQKKGAVLEEAYRVLRPAGELVIVDWFPHAVFGPKEKGWKLSAAEGRRLGEEAGFSFEREIHASSNHWGMVFKK